MKVDVFENRAIKIDGTEGTQNENNIQQLEINVPEKYKDYNKKIVFATDDGIVWDTIEGNTYTIRKNISKYKRVNFYVWLTKGDDDFRSVEKTLKFNDNQDASNEISEEEIGAVNKIINLLEEEIIKVTSLEARLTALIENVQFKLDNGEFNYILTEEDKQEISDLSVPVVEKDIQPTLEKNLKSAKDYTDNAIVRDFKDITFDETTMTIVFTRHDNTTFTIDLPIENTVKNGRYDAETQELVLILVSGQEIKIPASGLIDDYDGLETATIQCVVSADNKISCNIKAGSIPKTLLTTELQNEIDGKLSANLIEEKQLLITYKDQTTETVKLVVYK